MKSLNGNTIDRTAWAERGVWVLASWHCISYVAIRERQKTR